MAGGDRHNEDNNGDNANAPNPKSEAYLKELLEEKDMVDPDKCPNVVKLLDDEIAEVQNNQKVKPKDNRFVDVLKDKPTRVTTRVLVPVKEFPKFNFIGQLLGPKGSFLQQLQEETMCRILILGRGSKRDKAEEEALRQSGDPKAAHLHDPLHVEISAVGPPAEAHARVSYALAEVKKYLIPNNMDLMEPPRRPMPAPQPLFRGAGGGPPIGRGGNMAQRATQGKSKVMSILSKARMAMEECYDDGMEEYDEYDDYNAPGPVPAPLMRPVGGPAMRRAGGGDQGRVGGGWGPSKSRQSGGGGGATRPATGGRFRTAPYSKPGK